MIRVAALTGGQIESPARFRVRQHIKPLKNLGIQVHEYVPSIDKNAGLPRFAEGVNPKYQRPLWQIWQGAKLATRIPGVLGSWKSQMTWLGRELLPHRMTLEPLLKKPLVFDVDDAIWLLNSRSYSSNSAIGIRTALSISMIAKKADVVIAGNNYLAQWFADYTEDIRVIPTAVETERFQPPLAEVRQKSTQFVIGWTGSAGNLPYLKAIEAPLKNFRNQFTDSELLVIADRPPSFKTLSPDRVRYIPWSPDVEVEAVQQMDVGLMPLPDTEWAKGKCSFKMLQYMACGIPVVVSPVGMNAEVLALGQVGLEAVEESDWYEALVLLYKNREIGYEYGKKGRTVVEQNFSQRVVVEKLAKVFTDLKG